MASLRLVYHAYADVDGDGRPDLITLRTARTGPPYGRLEVALSSGRVLDVRTPSDASYLPDLVATGNVDGRPGEALFVDVEHITTDEVIDIYTYAGGRLRLGGTFAAYGEEYGIVFGITCSAHGGKHFVTQHEFELQSPSPHHWTLRDTVYVWRGTALRLAARGQLKPIPGNPPAALVGVQCGHAPVP